MRKKVLMLLLISALTVVYAPGVSGFHNSSLEDLERAVIERDLMEDKKIPFTEDLMKLKNRYKEYALGELIVKVSGEEDVDSIIASLDIDGMKVKESLGLLGYFLVEFPENMDLWSVALALIAHPFIEFVEPNGVAEACFVPNDPYYSHQWHFPQIGMETAWEISDGAGVTVAVLDTGVAYEDYGPYRQAPDLAGTTFVQGYDFVNDDEHPNDDNRHGTHVTGTIAQTTNNRLGVAGIAYKAKIMPVKVLNQSGFGYYSWIIEGIQYAADHGADIISMSLIGTAYSRPLEAAVNYAYIRGVVIIAAAGNNNADTKNYPAAYDNVIAVGATRYDKQKAPYSNYGSWVDLVAPGGDISVDQNGDGYGDGVLQQTFRSPNDLTDFGYWFFQGTSMSTPHVSGVAALLLAYSPTLTPDGIRMILTDTAEDLGDPGKDDIYGYGFVQAAIALQYRSIVIDQSSTTDERADVGSVQTIYFHAMWEHDSSDVRDAVVYVNNTAYTSNSTGWVSVNVSHNRVDKLTWTVTDIQIGGASKVYTQTAPNPLIVWDRVVAGLSVGDDRIDVGSTANITYVATYDYDNTTFVGTITYNDTLTKNTVGKYGYIVQSISDDKYNLTAVSSNAVSVIFDRVNITLTITDNRIDVGTNATITWSGVYEYDGAAFAGSITLNNTQTMYITVGKRGYTTLSISDSRYNLTAFTSNSVHCIWDRVRITLSIADDRIDVGDSASVLKAAVYEYDNATFVGDVALNDTLAKNVVGKYWYTTHEITDNQYGLTVFTSNSVYCIWDGIKIVEGGVTWHTAWFRSVYEYDGDSFDGTKGTLYANGQPMAWSSKNSRWEYVTWMPLEAEVSDVSDSQYALKVINDVVGPLVVPLWMLWWFWGVIGVTVVSAIGVYLIKIKKRLL